MRVFRTEFLRLRQFVAAVVLAHLLAILAMAACPALHEWVHPDSDSDDHHDCAVVLFVGGAATAAVAIVIVLAAAVRVSSQALPHLDRVEGIFRTLRIWEHAPPIAA
jgi:hypothetical protein